VEKRERKKRTERERRRESGGSVCEGEQRYEAQIFCIYVGLFCTYIGLFCTYIGLFCMYTGILGSM